jgi:hypothetical protein
MSSVHYIDSNMKDILGWTNYLNQFPPLQDR